MKNKQKNTSIINSKEEPPNHGIKPVPINNSLLQHNTGCKPDPKLFGQAFDNILQNRERIRRIVFANIGIDDF